MVFKDHEKDRNYLHSLDKSEMFRCCVETQQMERLSVNYQQAIAYMKTLENSSWESRPGA